MSQVSRPMQIALLVTVLLAAVWLVALRPKPASVDTGGPVPPTPAQEAPSAPGAAGLDRAVDQARGAADTARADARRAAGSSAEATTSSGARSGSEAAASGTAKPQRASGARHARRAAPADPHVRTIRAALRSHKAIALAFINPTASDARAVSEELSHVGGFGGSVVTLSVPIAHLSRYGFITREVDVTVAPTIVIVGPNREATTIVGFADRFEIAQRLADALAAK